MSARASHAERDVTMKRQLVEDLRTRLKILQEMEKSYRGQVEELEKKVNQLQLAPLSSSSNSRDALRQDDKENEVLQCSVFLVSRIVCFLDDLKGK